MLCSVVKHLGSGRALKKWGKTLDYVSCFPLLFFRFLRALQQNRAQSRLLYLLNTNMIYITNTSCNANRNACSDLQIPERDKANELEVCRNKLVGGTTLQVVFKG